MAGRRAYPERGFPAAYCLKKRKKVRVATRNEEIGKSTKYYYRDRRSGNGKKLCGSQDPGKYKRTEGAVL